MLEADKFDSSIIIRFHLQIIWFSNRVIDNLVIFCILHSDWSVNTNTKWNSGVGTIQPLRLNGFSLLVNLSKHAYIYALFIYKYSFELTLYNSSYTAGL